MTEQPYAKRARRERSQSFLKLTTNFKLQGDSTKILTLAQPRFNFSVDFLCLIVVNSRCQLDLKRKGIYISALWTQGIKRG